MMLTDVRDRDAIVSKAIEIASAEEREAYIARACGNDAELRRQVEVLVAAHFLDGKAPEKPAVADGVGALPPGRTSAQPGTPQAEEAPKRSRALAMAAALLLLAVVGGSIYLAAWAWRTQQQAQADVKQAAEEAKEQSARAEAARRSAEDEHKRAQNIGKERDEAVAAEKASQGSVRDTKAVLAFLQDNLLSAGRQKGWAGREWASGQKKDVTLREAVDAAEAAVAKTFADRPLAEASIREILGSAYLDLGEAALAVPQFERAMSLREAHLGPDHRDTGDTRNQLAKAYRQADRPVDAARLFKQNPDSPSHAAALAIHAAMLLSQKKPVEAELKLRESLAIRERIQPDDWSTYDTMSMLGEALLDQKKYADAEPLLVSGYEGLKKREASIPSQDKGRFTKALERLVQLYEARGEQDKAARWRKELEMVGAAKKS